MRTVVLDRHADEWGESFQFVVNGRPVDVQAMKDGSLLVSDDHAGAVYRVTYGSTRIAAR